MKIDPSRNSRWILRRRIFQCLVNFAAGNPAKRLCGCPAAGYCSRGMSAILESLQGHERRRFEAGQFVIRQGEQTDALYFLIEGAVEVLKDDVRVATATQPGQVFGEMAVLLGGAHTASVRAVKPCDFFIVGQPREFLKASPALSLHVAELLARRLDTLNKYLVDVKHQFEGHDHIGMVDEVLEALLHRQPTARVRPRESTIRHGEQ